MKFRLYMLLGATYVLLYWISSSSQIVGNMEVYGYEEKIFFGELFQLMAAIPLIEVFTNPLGIIYWIMLINLVFFPLLICANSRNRYKHVLMMLVVCSPMALFGLFSISIWVIFEAFQHDGEWLAEGWPVIESYFFWWLMLSLISSFFYYRSLDDSDRSHGNHCCSHHETRTVK